MKYENWTYNALRRLAAERNINMGSNPRKEVLIEALKEDKMSEKKKEVTDGTRQFSWGWLILALLILAIGAGIWTVSRARTQAKQALAQTDRALAQTEKVLEQNARLTEDLEQQQNNTQTETEPATGAVSTECPTTASAKNLTEVNVQRLATEPCAWVWRAVPEASTPAVCPKGFICTWDLGGQTAVYEGPARSGIVAGTWRFVSAYPGGDAVYEPCNLLRKEQEFGASEVPTFEVAAGNFECSD